MAKRRPAPLPPPHPSLPALSDTRPLFVDNQEGNTLDRALAQHLAALRQEGRMHWELCIASAFFNVGGYRLLADELDRVGKVRLLLGVEPTPEAMRPIRQPRDEPEPHFTERQIAEALVQLDQGLRQDRDLLPFDEPTQGTIRRLLAFLHSGKIEVRRHARRYLHAKVFLFRVVGAG
jgi:hypothetical protein